MLLEVLARSQLFTGLEPAEREILAKGGRQRTVDKDTVLIQMATTNHALLVVVSGSVRVERTDVEPPVELARLGAGAMLGEMSFVDGSKTSATVRAAERCEIFELRFDALADILEERPELAAKVWRNFSVELKSRVDKTNDLVKHYVDLNQVLRDKGSFADFIKCWC